MSAWKLQDAACSCDAVFNRALSGEPQVVTRHGVPELVVITYAAYRASRPSTHNVFDTLTSCPCDLKPLLQDESASLPSSFDKVGCFGD